MSQILKSFAYHKPSPNGLIQIQKLRQLFSQVERVIKDTPPGREQSIALTKNEEACMWAVKAVVINDPTSEVEMPRPTEVVADNPPQPGESSAADPQPSSKTIG